MFGPYVMQMVVLAVVFMTVMTSSSPCFDESQLEEKAQKKLRHIVAHIPDTQQQSNCPVGLYAGPDTLKDRSISPWRIVYDTDKDRFPHKIAVAECLCSGCITISEDNKPIEDFTYNSVAITQRTMVLKKERCADRKKYRLVLHSQEVAVGCTCVKPKN